ncbi:expressed unknown protein [Seminavis robusta]|uniref:Uncharacterized protein n=1 Tax=Seminavis robusta TaxID=568900 RepID=A0A9N8E0M9_9STRA|nr:expressed unknown protein [Seminavis robusta]|eukprot:Sro431_g141550.1 n/a (1000) ;mRNA; f:58538-61537
MEVYMGVGHEGEEDGYVVLKRKRLVFYEAGYFDEDGHQKEDLVTSGKTRILFHSIVDHTSTTSTSQEFLLSITDRDGATFVFQMETQEDLRNIENSISKAVAKAARASQARPCEPPNMAVAMTDESHTSRSEDMRQVREMTRQMDQRDRQAKKQQRSRQTFPVGATSVSASSTVQPRKTTRTSFPTEKFRHSAAPQQRTAPPHLVVEPAMPPPAEIEDKPPGAYMDPGPPIGVPLPQQSSPPIIDYDEEEPHNKQEDPLIEASLVPDDEEDQRNNEFQDETVVLVQAQKAGLSDYLQNRSLQIFIVGLICLFAIVIIVTVVAIVLATGNTGGGTNTPAPTAAITTAPIPTVIPVPTLTPTTTTLLNVTIGNYTPISLAPTSTPLDIPAFLDECNLTAVIPVDSPSSPYQSAGCFKDVDTLDSDQLLCGPDQAPLECSLRCPSRFFGIPMGTTTCRCFSQIKSDRIGLQACVPGSDSTSMDLFVNQSPRITQCDDPMARAVVEFLLQQRSNATWGFDIVSNRWKESPFELYAEGCHTNVYDVTVLEAEAVTTRETFVMDVKSYATQRRGERSVSILYDEDTTSEISVLAEEMEILAEQVSGVADPRQVSLFFYLSDENPNSKLFTTSAAKRLAKVEVTNFSEKTNFVTFSPSFRQSLLNYLNGGFQKEMAFEIFDRYGSFAVVRSMMGAFMELRLPLDSIQYDNTFDSIVHSQSCFEIATQAEASRLGFPDAPGTIDDTTCSPNVIRALQQLRSEYRDFTEEPATVGGKTECQLKATECDFIVDISTSRPLTANDKYPFGDFGGYQLRPLSDFLSPTRVSPLEIARMQVTEERFTELQRNLKAHTVEYLREMQEKLEACVSECKESDYPAYIQEFGSCPPRTCRTTSTAQPTMLLAGATLAPTLPPVLPPSTADSPVTGVPDFIPAGTNIPTTTSTSPPFSLLVLVALVALVALVLALVLPTPLWIPMFQPWKVLHCLAPICLLLLLQVAMAYRMRPFGT